MSAIAIRNNRVSDPVLRAVIIYDEFDLATGAIGLLERAAARLDEAVKWDFKPWRFDVLKQPTLATLTVAVAANADLVVLALNRFHSTSAELLDWLRNWAEHRRIEDAALLVLHAGAARTRSASEDELQQFADGHGVALLDSQSVWDEGSSAPFAHRWQGRKRLVAPGPARAYVERPPAPPHWGINE